MGQVVLKGINKFYDSVHAVKDVNLQIRDKEFVVFVGPSGCGKTTTLRMIAGLEVISSGDISIDGNVINQLAPMNRDIAMVFQNYALYPHMSVYDNQAFGLRLRRLARPEIDTRVRGGAGVLGLSHPLGKKPRQVSRGPRQRVAMGRAVVPPPPALPDQREKNPGQLPGGQRQRGGRGRAIVRRPAAFLMDEPLSNLDAKLRVQMRSEISRMQRDLATTMIYVTHDQTEAMTMGTQVAVMKRGDLQQVDTPDALFSRPANVFVAGFIGSPAMNFVNARLEASDGELFAAFAHVRLRVDEEAVQARPRLAAYAGQPVVLGIRPDATEDAAIARDAPADRRFSAVAELRETGRSEALAHFTLDEAPVVTEDILELAADTGADPLEPAAAESKTPFVARMHARSSAREGERVEVVVDTRELHFFDPRTSEGIY